MKPNFALNLTEDRIGLLQRTGKGWLPLGEVMFAADDMPDQLTALREKAASRAPRGISTKLVIPNSQILYTTVAVSAATDTAKRDEIRAALVGKTPYAVDDLVFDWAGDGPEVQVAVVARETLDEAEGFAVSNAFRPISFVAIPEDGKYDGEPQFGTTAFSVAALGKGRRLERDLVPIRIIGADTDVPAAEEPEIRDEQDDVETPPRDAVTEVIEAQDEREADLTPDSTDVAMSVEAVFPETVHVADEETTATNGDAHTAVADVQEDTPKPPAPRFTIAPVADQTSSVVSATLPDMDDEAPFADVSDQVAELNAGVGGQDDDDLPPVPSTAALMAFASRRAAADAVGKPVGPAPARGTTPGMPGLLADRLAARAQSTGTLLPQPMPTREMPSMVGGAATVISPVLPGGKKRKPTAAHAVAAPDAPRKPLTKPGGTFASSQPVRGKPRFLGLILTGILILFLALVAAVSSFYVASIENEGDATQVAGGSPPPDAPAVDDEMLADGQLSEDAVAGDVAATVPADVPVAEPPGETELSVDDSQDQITEEVAATESAGPAPETGVDVFDAGTAGPASVAADTDDDALFLSTADLPRIATEVASLAAPVAGADVLPATQLPPPPFGTEYTFNPNGTIQATADGILTPEGVWLVSGQPDARPPNRPAAIAAAAVAEPISPEILPTVDAVLPPLQTGPAVVGADPALADARPRSRPATLEVPATDDDAALATDRPVLAASLRPRTRPQTILAAGEDARRATEAASLATASAAAGSAAEAAILAVVAEPDAPIATPSGSRLAVSVSRIPAPRPRNLERAVAAALAAATRAPEPDPEPEPQQAAAAVQTAPEADAEPEVESAASTAPTSGTVAERATFANAINLSRINLIGVYGTQSNRYALIRQGNGRYKKVTVGDRIDGGTIAAITANEVRYQKGGRLIALQMPDT